MSTEAEDRELGPAADPLKVKNSKKKEKRVIERDEDCLAFVVSTPDGRRFFWNLLKDCGVFKESFVPAHADVTAYNEGQRNIGLKLLARITEFSPETYLKMMQEAQKEE